MKILSPNSCLNLIRQKVYLYLMTINLIKCIVDIAEKLGKYLMIKKSKCS